MIERPLSERRAWDQPKTARSRPEQRSVPSFFRVPPRLWLMDLDDTLLASSAGLLHEVHLRMNAFLTGRLGMSEAEANRLREQYWRECGSTFIGLWRYHGVDPRVFLPDVHGFDYSPYLREAKSVRRWLSALPGRRVLFTNGPASYAGQILPAIGLGHFFDAVITATDMQMFGDWRPKPSVPMMLAACARMAVKPSEAVLVDDSLMNLKAARKAGLKTVWCVGLRRRHAGLLMPSGVPAAHPAVDHVVQGIAELARRAGRIS